MTKQCARLVLTATSLAALLALGACGDRIQATARDADRGVPIGHLLEPAALPASAEASVAPETATMGAAAQAADDGDAHIAADVKQALATDADLSGMKIDVSSEDGAVTLRGRAPDPSARERASTLARTVREVRAVENLLTLG